MMPIDATRGLAMVCVALAHLGTGFAYVNHETLASVFVTVGYFATPNFLLFSGLVAAFQLAKTDSRAGLQRIVDRGLFIILAGHLFVCAALVYMAPVGGAFGGLVITDVIGIYLCLTPLLRKLTPVQLCVTGLVLFVVSMPVAMLWQPSGEFASVVGALGFGIPVEGWASRLESKLVPYLGIFMTGMAIGTSLPALQRSVSKQRLGTLFVAVGGTLVAVAVCLNVLGHLSKPLVLSHGNSNVLQILIAETNVRSKAIPSVAYWFCYGGAGILLIGLLMKANEQAWWLAPARAFAVIGRASFVSYVSQQWLVTFLPFWLGFNGWLYTEFVLVYLPLVVVAMYAIGWMWDRAGANRFLTVGLKPVRPRPEVAYAV
jgi:hypothetical protein